MKLRLLGKKVVSKKVVWVILLAFIATLVIIPKSESQAAVREDITYNNKIKILEIEPGNKFKLSTEISSTVEVTQVNMPQFISMVDEISGKYDVIVIGRENSGLDSVDTKQYRDYTEPLSNVYTTVANHFGETPFGNYKAAFIANDTNEVEYYPENDITNKRANEILKMIDSNQLVYLDNKILNNDISSTNLQKIIGNYNVTETKGKNLKKISFNNFSISTIKADYNNMNSDLKRPVVENLTKPADDKARYNDTNNTKKGDIDNRTMNFDITVNNPKAETIKVNLYIDVNADGLYKDQELVQTQNLNVVVGSNECTLNPYTISNDFVGYLDWKIEIVRSNGVKTNLNSNSQFMALVKAREIKVLQIYPSAGAGYLYLGENTSFKNIVAAVKQKGDYDIQIESCSVDTFNSWSEGTLKNSNGKFIDLNGDILNNQSGDLNSDEYNLNGKYDMIILGFADCYGYKNILTAGIGKIDSFIRTGQSVMFTHDTMTPFIDSTKGKDIGSKKLTQHFRDYLGLSRFKDMYRLENGIVDEKDIYKQVDSNGNLVEKTIPHISLNASDSGKYSSGASLRYNNRIDTTSVKTINKAQINTYPFGLAETITVANTHSQYYQLNLEDADLVPWFNLNQSSINTGDSRNNYYTYSKGNITFSGTGHSNKSSDYPETELRLFANTMIKAERGSNHKPEIVTNRSDSGKGPIEEGVNNVVSYEEDFTFETSATDLDGDNVNMTVKIDDGQAIVKSNMKQGDKFPVTIPKSYIEGKINDQIKVTVTATDPQGAQDTKTYTITPMDQKPDIEANLVGTYPVQTTLGKEEIVTYDIVANKFDDPYKGITNIPNDIVIVIDTSENMKLYGGSGQKSPMDQIKEIFNSYLVADDDKNKGEVNKYAVITYDSSGVDTIADFDDKSAGGSKTNREYVEDIFSEKQNNSNSKIGISHNPSGNAVAALGAARNILDTLGNKTSLKNIVFISAGVEADYKSNESNKKILDSIKAQNYNVITLHVRNNGNNAVKDIHEIITNDEVKKIENYIYAPQPTNSSNNVLKNINEATKEAIDKIKIAKQTAFIVKPKLTFNLNDNFDVVDTSGITKVAGNIIELPYIEYNLIGGEYIATDPPNVSFKVKSKAQGILEFGLSTFDYNQFMGGSISKYIGTPIFNCFSGIDHGVFKKIDSTTDKAIFEADGLSFAKGAKLQFGANIDVYNNTDAIELIVDSNCIINSMPSVFKIVDHKLEELGKMTIVNGKYQYKVTGYTGKVVVLYNVALNNPQVDGIYTNTIIYGQHAYARVRNSNINLPDLF